MTHEEKLDAVQSALWRRTHEDWMLTVNHILTEPVCPVASIACENEDSKWQYWAAHRDTIPEAIEAVVDIAYWSLFEGSKDIGVPWTEPTLRQVPTEDLPVQ